MDLVLKLRELRRKAGLTQVQLAEKSGVGERTISFYETGYRISSIKVQQLEAIVVACGSSLEHFFSRDFEDVLEELAWSPFNHSEMLAMGRVLGILHPFGTGRAETMLRFLIVRERATERAVGRSALWRDEATQASVH